MDTDNLVALRSSNCIDFRELGKPEYPQKNPWSTGEMKYENSLKWNIMHQALF